MEWIELGKLFKIKKGKKVIPAEEENENTIRYIQIDDLRNDNNIKFCEKNEKYVYTTKNDLIIAWDGANAGTIGYDLEGAIGSTLAVLEPQKNCLSPKFGGIFLKSKFKYFQQTATGATIPHINKQALQNLKIPVPSLEEQEKIVRVLDEAQNLIDKRKEQIDLMDELTESIFYEMFGDPVVNSKNWDVKKLGKIGKLISGGTPSRSHPEYFQGNIPWITTTVLGKNNIDEKDAIEYITEEAVDKSATKIIPANSLMFGMRVGVGKISINKVEMCTNQDIMSITNIDNKEYNLMFLKNTIEKYSLYFNNQKRGATIKGIKSSTLREIDIPIVSLTLQNEFSEKVKAIEEQKKLLEKSLNLMEDNYNALMQKAFK